jgi:metal-responsive CopG/Arc/MetJ family transcriptional regulator
MPILDSPRRGRPKKDSVMGSVAVRLSEELLEEVDEYLSVLSEQLPGLSISRADAIRQLIAVGLRSEKTRFKITSTPTKE